MTSSSVFATICKVTDGSRGLMNLVHPLVVEMREYSCSDRRMMAIAGIGPGLSFNYERGLRICLKEKGFFGVGVKASASIFLGLTEAIYVGDGICTYTAFNFGLGAGASLGVMLF